MKKIFYIAAFMAALSFTACDVLFGDKEKKEEQTQNEQVAENESVTDISDEETQPSDIVQEEPVPVTPDLKEFEKRFIAAIDESMVTGLEDGMTYLQTEVEGKDFICSIAIDERIFSGMTMKQAFEYVGMNEQVFAQVMKQGMQTDATEEEMEMMDKLYQYQYNVNFRLLAEPSGEVMNCILGYEEFKR